MPLILVQNEVTVGNAYDFWNDITGEQYHFPNKYIGRIKEGEPFIYYKGTRRANNLRSTPEYFGTGIIGTVRLDESSTTKPKRNWWWFCDIEDYVPFQHPVLFKKDGISYEKIRQNQWGEVRTISDNIYSAILEEAGLNSLDVSIASDTRIELPPINKVIPQVLREGESVLISMPNKEFSSPAYNKRPRRYTKHAKINGDRAEEIVFNLLKASSQFEKVRWIANEKLTPGWDIEYQQHGEAYFIEVKGTSGERFTSIDITANEWNAAKKKGTKYSLYLVANCLGTVPKVEVINNPYALFEKKVLRVEPLNWSISR